jgi:hypothetical protein
MPLEVLGHVTVPSGVLVIGDMGYLGDWSGEDPPAPPPGVADVRDCRVVGADAAAAAARFNRQSLTYLYDIPDVADLRALFDESIGGLDAELVEEDRRIPHRERAARAAAAGAGDFIINGVWFTVVALSADRALMVVGERDPDNADAWRWVEVVVSEAPRAVTRKVGLVGVDWARLIVADADALSAWEHEDALDGLADVAFWGRDEDQAAKRFKPDRLREGVYGWPDLPLERAVALATEIDAWRRKKRRGLAVDFRPHSHHYYVMEQVRSSDTASGVITVGGADVLGFGTWGDGIWEVEVDSDPEGQVVAVRVVFG